jgi:hypothetical protein
MSDFTCKQEIAEVRFLSNVVGYTLNHQIINILVRSERNESEDCRRLGFGAVCVLLELMFWRNVSLPSS